MIQWIYTISDVPEENNKWFIWHCKFQHNCVFVCKDSSIFVGMANIVRRDRKKFYLLSYSPSGCSSQIYVNVIPPYLLWCRVLTPGPTLYSVHRKQASNWMGSEAAGHDPAPTWHPGTCKVRI